MIQLQFNSIQFQKQLEIESQKVKELKVFEMPNYLRKRMAMKLNIKQSKMPQR
jgi:hypothetical protein